MKGRLEYLFLNDIVAMVMSTMENFLAKKETRKNLGKKSFISLWMFSSANLTG